MADTLEVTILGKDELSGALKSIQGSMEGLADVAKGALTVSLGIATAAFGAASAAIAVSIKEAMDAEANMAQLDATLKAVGATATQAANEWAAAQGQFVESTKLSADEVEKLKQKSSDLEFEIRKQEDALNKATSAKKVDAIAVEEHQRAIEKLKRAFAETNQEIADGTKVIKTDLVTALGLAQPAAMMTKDELIKLSMSLRDLAGGSDDAVLGVETVLLRMGVAKDVFPQATKAILDASAALGRDLQTTAQMVGKTLVAPGEGLMKLKAIGATFTDSQEKMIKSLVASGKAAEAQKFILDALAKTTEGAAEAKAKTFGGQLEILRGHMLEVAENVGNQLLPVLSSLAKEIMPTLEKVAAQIGASFTVLLPHFLKLGESVGTLITKVLEIAGVDISEGGLLVFVMNATTFISQLVDEATKFTAWVTANLAPAMASAQTELKPLTDAFKNLSDAIAKQMPAVIANLDILKEKLSAAFAIIGPELIGNLSGIINKLAEIWSKHGDTIMAIIRIAFGGVFATIAGALILVTTVVESVLIWLSGLFDAFSLLLQGNWQGAWDALVLAFSLAILNLLSGFESFFNGVLSLLGTNMDSVRETWSTNWELVKTIALKTWENIQTLISKVLIDIILAVKKFLADVVEKLEGMKAKMIELGSSLMGWLLEGIRSATQGIIDAVANAVGRAVSEAKRLLPLGTDVEGRNLGTRVDDAIIAPGGRIITTSPDDFLIATKNPGGLIGAGAGNNVTVYFTYAPAVSLGDRYEAEQTLVPLIRQALRSV